MRIDAIAGDEPIVVERYFEISCGDLFRAWTEPERVMKWFGHRPNSLHSAAIDLRKDGAWRFLETSDGHKDVGFEGQYLEVQQDRRLVFTWVRATIHADGTREESLHATIDVRFTPTGRGTTLRLTHTPSRPQDSRAGIGDGWAAAFASLPGAEFSN